MVSVCLPSDALLQHLPSYLGFSYLGHGVSLHGCSSKAQQLLLTSDEGYLLTTALPDLQCGIAPLGPSVPAQPGLLGCGVGPPGHHPWPRSCGCSSLPLPLHSSVLAWRIPRTGDPGGEARGSGREDQPHVQGAVAARAQEGDRKSTRLNSSHTLASRMPSSA